MSFKAQRWIWQQPLTATEKVVLLKLAFHADPNGANSYPSVDSIATDTGIGKRQVQRYLKAFVDRGFLAIEDHEKGGRGRTRVYGFTFLNSDTEMSPFEAENDDSQMSPIEPERVTSNDVKGDISEPERVTSADEKGDIHARAGVNPPEQPIEQPREPDTPKPPSALDESFDRFWRAYPRRVGKDAARRWWRRKRPAPELVDAMLANLRAWRDSGAWDDVQYIPYPATWLNRGGWDDEPPLKPSHVVAFNCGFDPLRTMPADEHARYLKQLEAAIARSEAAERERRSA